jgi:hypothetical protein
MKPVLALEYICPYSGSQVADRFLPILKTYTFIYSFVLFKYISNSFRFFIYLKLVLTN